MHEENETRISVVGRKRVALTVIGAIVFGAIGSGLWEMLAKPGLSTRKRKYDDVL